MPRTISGKLTTEVAKGQTRPFALIYIGFASPLRLSTGGTVTYESNSWVGGYATLEDLRTLAGGAMEGAVSIGNADGLAGASVLGSSLQQVQCQISVLYGSGPFSAGDAELVFDGYLDGADISATRVRLGITTGGRRRSYGPRLYCSPPLCNYLPPAGTRLVWGGETFELVRSPN